MLPKTVATKAAHQARIAAETVVRRVARASTTAAHVRLKVRALAQGRVAQDQERDPEPDREIDFRVDLVPTVLARGPARDPKARATGQLAVLVSKAGRQVGQADRRTAGVDHAGRRTATTAATTIETGPPGDAVVGMSRWSRSLRTLPCPRRPVRKLRQWLKTYRRLQPSRLFQRTPTPVSHRRTTTVKRPAFSVSAACDVPAWHPRQAGLPQ